MGIINLVFSLLMLTAPDCQRTNRQTPITAKECWAWVVMGESGGNWKEASYFVAWTLRAWELYLDMPADQVGRRWGWNGWKRPNSEARQAVDAVWEQSMLLAPWDFMKYGGYCKRLGSAEDVRLWRSLGAWGNPYMTIPNPQYPNFSVNCYLGTKWNP